MTRPHRARLVRFMPPKLTLLRRVFAPVHHAGLWLRGAPRWLQAAIVLVLLGVAGVGGYYLLHKRAESRTQRAVAEGWKHFDEAARTGDEPGMRTALDEVLAAAPENPLAARRKQTLETFDADPADEPMVLLSLRLNLRANNLPGAAREAEKRLGKEPKDWLARCVRAAHALTRGDRAAAEADLAALPSPDDPRARLDPAGLLLAFQLYRSTGRPSDELRALVQTRLVAAVRSSGVQGLPPGEKLGFVECYLEGFEPAADKPQPSSMVQAWAAVSDLADRATDEAAAAGTVPVLARAGRLAPRLALGLDLFRRHGQVTAEQYAELAKELEGRARRAWQAVLVKEPKNHEAFHGMAMSHLRANEYAAGREWTVRGLTECGDDPNLGALFSRLLQLEGRPMLAWNALASTARANPGKTIWWVLAAEAALAAGRRDLALDACAEVRKADPGNPRMLAAEASMWLAAGDASKAAQLLHQLGEPALAVDPRTARLYTGALAESGLDVRVDGFLALAEEAAVKANSPAPIAAALRGLVDAPPDAARAAAVAARADRLLTDRWPDHADLFRLRADALARVAELSSPAWDPPRVRAAVQAYDRLRAKLPDDAGAAFGLAALHLYGEDNPEQAVRDLAPVRVADGTLTARQLELFGQAYRRTGKPTEAAAVLERAVRMSDAPAGCYTQLALAYHALGRDTEARTLLAAAGGRKRDDREHAEYVAAVKAIRP